MDITVNGADYPITQKFRDEVLGPHPDLANRTLNELENLRGDLLRLSTRRHNWREPKPKGAVMALGGTLTIAEADRLACITHVLNVHQAVNFLQGRLHTEFGFDGIDQVHGNAVHAPCGCILHHVFNHHKRHEKTVTTYPHYPRCSCDAHAHLAGDFKAHHATVLADNISKA